MPKFIDITGEKFGEWTVLEYVGDSKWLCRCSCGEVKQVLGKTLRNGTSKTCGHSIVSVNIGDKCGELEVVDIISDKKCLVMCSCGKVGEAYIYDIMSGKRKDCGHGRSEKLRKRNESQREIWEGKKLDEWDILEYLGEHKYKCRCSCGKEKVVDIKLIKRGSSKSCGHNKGKSQIEDLSGKRFGSLIAKKYVGKKRWLCLCDCGNNTIVLGGNLRNGSVKSCGCKQYTRLSKEEILNAIQEYEEVWGEKPYIRDISDMLNRYSGNLSRYIKEYDLRDYFNSSFRSRMERDFYNEIGVEGIRCDRSLLGGLELDIYYKEKNLAVEFNGTYWHSDIYREENYHQMKTLECMKKGVDLVHVFEYEWLDTEKREKIVNLIKGRLGVGKIKVIYARDTEVMEVADNIVNKFINNYHLQNSVGANIRLGCFYKGELVGVMTFGKPRFNNRVEYELLRLVWKSDIRVVGGAEKLFNFFKKKYNPESIITYSDLSKFNGKVYIKLGFNRIEEGITKPNYVWVNNITNVVMTRYQTMKKELIKNNLGKENQTEDEIMRGLGFFKIYDCGNLKLLWKKECKENGR